MTVSTVSHSADGDKITRHDDRYSMVGGGSSVTRTGRETTTYPPPPHTEACVHSCCLPCIAYPSLMDHGVGDGNKG